MRLCQFLLFETVLWSAFTAALPYYDSFTSSVEANGAAYTPYATVSSLWAQQTG